MLTKKQKLVLDFITDYQKRKGYSPSLDEIRKKFKLASVSTAHFHIKKLQEGGYIKKVVNHPRAIEVYKLVQIPLLGIIAAGRPIEAIENRETIAVASNKVPHTASLFALLVQGDSMKEENIHDGDTILIKQQQTAENGQTVVALVNGDHATVKKYYRENDHIRLQPANKDFQPIIIKDEDFAIQGIVHDIIKTSPTTLEKHQQETYKNVKPRPLELNKIYLGNCIDLMKNIEEERVDLIFADPPYNLSKSNFKMSFKKSGGKDLTTNKGDWDRYSEGEFELFTEQWLAESYRILKKHGTIWVAGSYHNIYLVGHLMKKIGFEILGEILWHKSDATPNLSCTRFVADHENFIWARKGKGNTFNYNEMRKLNGGKQMRSLWTRGKTAGGKRIHPTQKPEWLLERVILSTSNRGDIVFDPFMGSGTTAVVSKRLSRSFLGFEIDPEYYKETSERIKNA